MSEADSIVNIAQRSERPGSVAMRYQLQIHPNYGSMCYVIILHKRPCIFLI
jgi:hypothetical protein